ncbi:MAG TPA: ATP-binding protein [Kofleriaceae bacterium]
MTRGRGATRRSDGVHMRGVVDRVSAMLAYWDSDQRCRFANRAYEYWFGVTPESLIGKHISELLGPLYALNKPYIEGALRGEPQEFEREIPHPHGGRSRHSLANYIPDVVDGKVRGFYVLVTDISDVKRSEMEQTVLAETGTLLASSLNYKKTLTMVCELITRHVADMCIIDMFDHDTKLERLTVVHADPAKAALAEMLAQMPLDAKHTLGAHVLETHEPQVLDDITPEFIEARAQNAEHARLLRELGSRSALVVPLVASEKVHGALVLVASRPHRYDNRDIALVTEIARRAVLAIQNARLYEAEQRATRARDEILGIVAHDVRSPLHSIRLAAELLQRRLAKIDEVPGQAHVSTILRSIERANHLIQDLLDVSRIEAGSLAVAHEVVAPQPILDELSRAQQHVAEAASIELRITCNAALPDVLADRHRLLQVLENLVGNALKFTPHGGTITIAASEREADVLFSVADTGAGIAEDHLQHIFDRFWQSNRTSRRGAGLGLPICKGIIESHGGQIWVESTLGVGTTFFFTVPRAASRAAARPASDRSAATCA